MNGKTIGGIIVLVLGVVIAAILCGLGGYAKGAVEDGIKSRLEYELPKGYEKDPNFEQCYKSINTPAFDEEYYLWDMTNKDEVLTGAKANFNLVGPFSYTEHYCEYDHKIDEANGILTYKRYTYGFHYMPSEKYPTDDLFITNVNPAYVGLLATLGGNDSPATIRGAMVGPTLEKIINTIQGAAVEIEVLFGSSIPFNDWSNFGYAQWGSFVIGRSLSTLKPMPYIPEIAGYNTSGIGDASCVTYTIEEAKFLLNGSHGLFNSANVGDFTRHLQAGNFTGINSYWGLTPAKAVCLANYLSNTILGQIIEPIIGPAIPRSGLFLTRSVRDWMFNGTDAILAAFGRNPSNSLKSNTTITKENAVTVKVRIYTGKNDLYHSLMPVNQGEVLTFWKEPVTITGFNGSQFLPNGYVDDAKEQETYPLELFHPLINRSIPFQNKGADKWDGVKVRYLTLSDDALASDTINPKNSPYFATYSGAINKTSNPPSYLPIFLTTPNFGSAEAVFTENVTFTDTLFADYNKDDAFSRHRLALFVLVEPTLGSTVWGNLPIQINFKISPSAVFNGVRPAYMPMYWNAIGDIATPKDLDDIKTTLYGNQRAWKIMIGVGVGAGVSFIVAGIVLIHHFRKHENELKD